MPVQEIDVHQRGGFWLPSMPWMRNLNFRVPGNTTLYIGPAGSICTDQEEIAQAVIPRPAGIRALLLRTIGEEGQPGDGDLLIRIRNGGQDTPLLVVVPRGSTPPHTYAQRTQRALFELGDLFSIALENQASTDSVLLGSLGMDLEVVEGTW